MRKDLNKLLCERERWNSGDSFGNYRKQKQFTTSFCDELGDLPLREGMRKRYKVGGNWKTFGENLNPLLGFIRKSVGKPWNDSYGELCSVFNMNSVINQHIVQHLFDFVERHVYLEDGELYYRTNWGSRRRRVLGWDGCMYYVDPADGILKENTSRTSYRTYQRLKKAEEDMKEAINRRVISSTLEYRRRDEEGPWFACTIAQVPTEIIYRFRPGATSSEDKYAVWPERLDCWDRVYVSYANETRAARPPFKLGSRTGKTYVSSMRTASRKELKKHGII